jgi:RNA polymerase primary sigma factor
MVNNTNTFFIPQDEIKSYLKDIRKYADVITKEKEIELTERLLSGDERAREELINANLRFVISIAKTYQNNGIPLSDLIAEGNLGLLKAIDKFDRSKGYRFISYAVWWIKQSIIESINEHSRNIRIPVNQINDYLKAKKENKDSDDELVDMFPTTQSIFGVINDEGDELLDVIEDDNALMPDYFLNNNQGNLKSELEKLLLKLDEKERQIIKMYFGIDGEPMTLEAIGDELDLTKERIRQIKQKSINKIRSNAIDLFKYFE